MEFDDCVCRICMYILIEPVRLPCGHELCLKCFKATVQQSNLTCPMCRIRIASWSRIKSKQNKLVDIDRWNQIKVSFPEQVHRRMNGLDDDDITASPTPDAMATRMLCKPGEIRREYQAELKKMQDLMEEQRRRENEASERLIEKLQKSEMVASRSRQYEILEQNRLDEDLARHLAQENESNASPKSDGLGTPRSATRPHSAQRGKPPRHATPSTESGSTGRKSRNSASATIESFIERIRKSDEARKDDARYSAGGGQCVTPGDDPLLSQTVGNTDSRCGSLTTATKSANFPAIPEPIKFSITPYLERSEIFPDASLSQSAFKSSLPPTPVATNSKSSRQTAAATADFSKSSFKSSSPVLSLFVADAEKTTVDGCPKHPTDSTAVEFDPPSSSQNSRDKPSTSGNAILADSDSLSGEQQADDGAANEEVGATVVNSRIAQLKRSNSSSSIDRELAHFRPIETCAKTPPRRLPGGQIVEPKIIKCTPRNVPRSNTTDDDRDVLSPDSNLGSPIMRRRLGELIEERKLHIEECSKSTSTSENVASHGSGCGEYRVPRKRVRLGKDDDDDNGAMDELNLLGLSSMNDDGVVVKVTDGVPLELITVGMCGDAASGVSTDDTTDRNVNDYSIDVDSDHNVDETLGITAEDLSQVSADGDLEKTLDYYVECKKPRRTIEDYFSLARGELAPQDGGGGCRNNRAKRSSDGSNKLRSRGINEVLKNASDKINSVSVNVVETSDCGTVGKLRNCEMSYAKLQENSVGESVGSKSPGKSRPGGRSRLVRVENVLASDVSRGDKLRAKCNSVPASTGGCKDFPPNVRDKLVSSATQLESGETGGRGSCGAKKGRRKPQTVGKRSDKTVNSRNPRDKKQPRKSLESDYEFACELQKKFRFLDRYGLLDDIDYSLRKRRKKSY